jgi:ribulose-phosphate 3-epimerase
MLKHQIVPAILVKDKKALISRLKDVHGLVNKVQIDIMDNKFVRNKTIQLDSFKDLKTKLKLEIHLMVKDPISYVDVCKKVKASLVIFHIESCKNKKEVLEVINKIKKNKMKIGIAINPETSSAKVKPFLKKINQVLVMTVNPGFGGQGFISPALKKVKSLRKSNRKIDIEVDGGINLDTINKASSAGANVFVAGSAVFGKNDKRKAIDELYKKSLN